MPGLLDFIGDDAPTRSNPYGMTGADRLGLLGQALMGFGSGLSRRRAPGLSLDPNGGDPGTSGFGEAAAGAAQAYRGGMQDLQRRALLERQIGADQRQAQMDAIKLRQATKAEADSEGFRTAIQSGDQAKINEAFRTYYPKEWWAAQQKDEAPLVVAPGSTVLDKRTGRPTFTAPAKPENEPEMLRVMKAAGIDPGTPQGQRILQDRLARWGQGAQVNIDMKQDGAAAKKIGELEGDMYGNMQKAGMNAQVKIGKLQRLEDALKDAPQGALGPQTQRLREVAESLGVKGLTGDAAPGQIARSISQEIALQLRDPSSGAGMPGAMSDADRQFLQQMVPGLANTPEGNAQLLDYMKRLHQREIDVAKLAREHKNSTKGGKAKGSFDDGFFDDLAAWSAKNPLFPEAATMKPPQAAPAQAPQASAAVPPPAQRQRGQVYDTPKGPMTWTGTGWVPAR